MITDVSAFCGAWPTLPVQGRMDDVRRSLEAAGVSRALLTPLDAVWCRNPHLYNEALYDACDASDFFTAVPAIDPTVATWRAAFEAAMARSAIKTVRVFPAYSSYGMAEAEPVLAAAEASGARVIVQTRMEDPRRQHPLALVGDVAAAGVFEAARKFPGVTVVVAGARAGDIRKMKDVVGDAPNLYADVSQADGMDVMRVLVDDGLGERLLFGSHAPLFIPHAAVRRVLDDLDDDEAGMVLHENAERAFGP